MKKKGSNKLGLPTKIAYGSGDFYGGASVTIVSLLFLYYLTDVVRISPIVAGTVMLVGRIVDGSVDPLIGILTDRTRTRWGRRVPYFLFLALPVGLVYVALWSPPPLAANAASFFATEGGKATYYAAVYVLSVIAFSMVMTPYAALAPELTDDYDERSSLVNVRMTFSIVGALVASTVPNMIIRAFPARPEKGYQAMALVFGSLFCVLWIVLFFFFKGKEKTVEGREEVGLKEGLQAVLRNRSFGRLLGIYLCSFLANDVLASSFVYFLRSYLVQAESLLHRDGRSPPRRRGKPPSISCHHSQKREAHKPILSAAPSG